MAIQRQMEQNPPVFSVMVERAGGERLGRDRTTITKEVRNYSVEQDTGYSDLNAACKR